MTSYIQFNKSAILDKLERINNSRNGNPRYFVQFNGLGIEGNTKSDASYAYKICGHWEGKPVQVTYHFTPKGRLVIDDLTLTEG